MAGVYPQNFKEAIISAVPNCTTMVLGMMTMNLWIYGHLTWENFWSALAPVIETGFAPSAGQYFMALPRNCVVDLALQVLVAYRLGCFVLGKYKNMKASINVAK